MGKMASEAAWWGDCTNTAGEEAKQIKYASLMGLDVHRISYEGGHACYYDLGGRSVLDIGGGPVSLLLKCRNRGRSVVADPIAWPQWVLDRYAAAGVEFIQAPGEGLDLGEGFDEVWLYNVLQHVDNPVEVIQAALGHGRVIRVFEWLNVPTDEMHPHRLTAEFLNEYLGTWGSVQDRTAGRAFWGCTVPESYAAVIGDQRRLRLHLLGLAHLPTRREFLPCAYTQKIIKLARMMRSLNHEVIFYGVEGSEVDCSQFVPILSEAERLRSYPPYDWHAGGFRHDGGDEAHRLFNENAIREIGDRKAAGDLLLCTMGSYQQPIAEAHQDLLSVESGVGYPGVFAKFRVFESYAWMHWIYGRENRGDGNWYDCVIPNYFDPDDFPYQERKEDYALYIGRIIRRKGVDVAVEATRRLGIRLKIAGQGTLKNDNEGLDIQGDHVEYVGVAGPEQRAELMGKARMVFLPTYYIEPFGGVAVEAQICGTPVITTDWGAFPETVQHGVTGFRCRTLDDFLWAAQHAGDLSPFDCHRWAVSNYSMDRVRLMYDEFLGKVADLYRGGWYELHPQRQDLDWLRRWNV